MKRSHTFKFCERLKASNYTWQQVVQLLLFHPRNDLRKSEIKFFPGGGGGGGMPTHPPSGRTSHALLCFAKNTDQVHTGTPLFKILDPPLVIQLLQPLSVIVVPTTMSSLAPFPCSPSHHDWHAVSQSKTEQLYMWEM